MTTPVIFRAWRKEPKTVIALFPTIPSSVLTRHLCSSYEHVGQHGGADTGIVLQGARPATKEEYAPLLAELKAYGDGQYNDLKVYDGIQPWMNKEREKTWEEMMEEK